jgi:polyhydroxyalkanoate synthase
MVYLLEWTDPDDDDAHLGLDEHVEEMISPVIDAVLQATGRRQAILAGHSLGGTLAAIAAAMQPDRIGGLVLIEAPLHFGPEAGALASLFEMTMPRAAGGLGQRLIPGSFLTLSAVLASPDAFVVAPWFDWLSSTGSHGALVHLCVQRWVKDELAMPGQLAIDIGNKLYRDDRFAAGALTIGGKPITPDPLSQIPTLVILEPSSRLVPPGSALGIFASLPTRALHVFRYRKEVGVAVQHVGALVGRRAHRLLWPKILDWMTAQIATLD